MFEAHGPGYHSRPSAWPARAWLGLQWQMPLYDCKRRFTAIAQLLARRPVSASATDMLQQANRTAGSAGPLIAYSLRLWAVPAAAGQMRSTSAQHSSVFATHDSNHGGSRRQRAPGRGGLQPQRCWAGPCGRGRRAGTPAGSACPVQRGCPERQGSLAVERLQAAGR